jgi:hypothetical protein
MTLEVHIPPARLLLPVLPVDGLLTDAQAQGNRFPGQTRLPGLADQGRLSASHFLVQFGHRVERFRRPFSVH